MKNLIALFYPIVLFLLSYYTISILPWYGIGILAGILAYILPSNLLKTILGAFAAGFAAWFFTAQTQDIVSEQTMSARIGTLFGHISPIILKSASGMIGGITALLGALVGYTLKDALFVKKSELVEKKS